MRSRIKGRYQLIINGTGRYVKHSSIADCGTTGRKLAVDFYGGNSKLGGGSPWTKDASKADLTLNLAARRLAINYSMKYKTDVTTALACCIGKQAVDFIVQDTAENTLAEGTMDINPQEICKEFKLTPRFMRLCAAGGCSANINKTKYGNRTMKTELVKLSQIRVNGANPRIIKDDKFAKLVNSILDFPKMLELRPIVVDDTLVCLGGNMRYRALTFIAEMPIDDLKSRLCDIRGFQKKPKPRKRLWLNIGNVGRITRPLPLSVLPTYRMKNKRSLSSRTTWAMANGTTICWRMIGRQKTSKIGGWTYGSPTTTTAATVQAKAANQPTALWPTASLSLRSQFSTPAKAIGKPEKRFGGNLSGTWAKAATTR